MQCSVVPTLRQVKVKREPLWHGYGRTFVTLQVTVEAGVKTRRKEFAAIPTATHRGPS